MGRYTGDSGLFTYAEYKNRGVIKLAPDVLVFISNNMGTTVIAPVRGATQKIDFKDGISSVSVQNNVDPPGSSNATIEVIAPIHDSNYWVTLKGDNGQMYKNPYFVPMMEVKIFLKGRYLVGDTPRYYPAFWGFITNVEDSYSGGVYKLSLNCADMLHWWNYMQVLFKPDVPSQQFSNTKPLNVYGSTFGRSNAFEIIYNLVNQTGFESFTVPTYLTAITPGEKQVAGPEIENIWKGMMHYWRKRFSAQANFLRMYGARGQLINKPLEPPKSKGVNEHGDSEAIDDAKLAAAPAIPIENFDLEEDAFTQGFPVYMLYAEMGIDSAEYQSKLEIATQVKTKIEYEFFQDVNGNFIFKPPYYNLNTKHILPYRIKPVDILNYSFGVNSDEIVTTLEVQTGLAEGISGENAPVSNIGYHMDLDLTERYGERFQRISLQYLTDTSLTQSVAVGHLSKMNLNAYFGSVTIPGRPELKLGYPVYIEHKDRFYYVASINHSFDFSGSFTTTLSLKGERPRVYDLDKSGGWAVQKNKIYLWHKSGSGDPNITSEQAAQIEIKDPAAIKDTLVRGANYVRSGKVGQYIIADLDSLDVNLRAKAVTVQTNSTPYTDEDGYKVIGSFRHGRGIVLRPGTVLDGGTGVLNVQSSANYNAESQAMGITNMKPASDLEGNDMNDYFTTQKAKKIETAIPEYLETLPMDEETYNRHIVNSAPKESDIPAGAGTVGTPLTAEIAQARSDANAQAISDYAQQKGAAPGGVAGYFGNPEKLAANCAVYDSEINDAVNNQQIIVPPLKAPDPRYQVSANLVKAVMMRESGGKPMAMSSFYITTGNKLGDEQVGDIGHAYGLMQFREATIKDMEKYVQPPGRKLDPRVPKDAIDASVAYLGLLKKQFNGDETKAIAAYNAGPGAVKKYNGVPPYKETMVYVPVVNRNKAYLEAQDKARAEAAKAPKKPWSVVP